MQDIAVLRWRLWRLQRAEGGILAVRKQKVEIERHRLELSKSPPRKQTYSTYRYY